MLSRISSSANSPIHAPHLERRIWSPREVSDIAIATARAEVLLGRVQNEQRGAVRSLGKSGCQCCAAVMRPIDPERTLALQRVNRSGTKCLAQSAQQNFQIFLRLCKPAAKN
jgi:hypothetical protein